MSRRAGLAATSLVVSLVVLVTACRPSPNIDEESLERRIGQVELPMPASTPNPGDTVDILAPSAPPVGPVEAPAVQRRPDRTLDGAYFTVNSSVLTAAGEEACRRIAGEAKGRTGFVSFLGFADVRPTDTYRGGNEQLSKDRARAVATCVELELQSLGQGGPVTLVVDGLGILCPRTPNPVDQENRRVEVFFTAERVRPVSAACPPGVGIGA